MDPILLLKKIKEDMNSSMKRNVENNEQKKG